MHILDGNNMVFFTNSLDDLFAHGDIFFNIKDSLNILRKDILENFKVARKFGKYSYILVFESNNEFDISYLFCESRLEIIQYLIGLDEDVKNYHILIIKNEHISYKNWRFLIEYERINKVIGDSILSRPDLKYVKSKVKKDEAEWICDEDPFDEPWNKHNKCSNCNTYALEKDKHEELSEYCPSCGFKMIFNK